MFVGHSHNYDDDAELTMLRMRGTTSIFCTLLHGILTSGQENLRVWVMDSDCAVLAHSDICIMCLHPTRGTDYIHFFIVEGVAVYEVNAIAAGQEAYQVQRGGKGR